MLEVLFTVIAICGAIIASITDIKHGIIPNRLSLSLIILGILGNLVYGTYAGSFNIFFLAVQGFLVIFILGYLFWWLGGWSAGDAKEFLFLAVLIPQYPEFLKGFINPYIAPYPFVLTILANTFLAILPFVVFYAIYTSRHRLSYSKFFEPLKKIDEHAKSSFVILAALSLITVIDISGIFLLIAVVGLMKLKEEYRIPLSVLLIFLYIIFYGGTIYAKFGWLIKYFITLFIIISGFKFFWNALGTLRKEALQEEIRITDLREGIVLAEEIYIDNDKVIRESRDFIEKIRDSIAAKDLSIIKKRDVVVSTAAAGIDVKGIELLKDYVKEGKLEDRIMIKKSTPFAPAILLGLIISLSFGDVPLVILEVLM